MGKISSYPLEGTLAEDDYIPFVDDSTTLTKRFLISTLLAYIFDQSNIPTSSANPITRQDENHVDFVASGCVWSGDTYGSSLNGSMTVGVVYINGRRLDIAAITARTFTASKDTYIDILDDLDGTYTVVYTEVANAAAAPTLAANSLRLGYVVTDASDINAATDVHQSGGDGLGNELRPLRDGVWKDYSNEVTFTNVTVGNGTVKARYCREGDNFRYRIHINAGSTTSFANSILHSLPVKAHADYGTTRWNPVGTATAHDSGTAVYGGWSIIDSSTSLGAILWNSTTAAISAVFPFTEASGDDMAIEGVYERAA